MVVVRAPKACKAAPEVVVAAVAPNPPKADCVVVVAGCDAPNPLKADGVVVAACVAPNPPKVGAVVVVATPNPPKAGAAVVAELPKPPKEGVDAAAEAGVPKVPNAGGEVTGVDDIAPILCVVAGLGAPNPLNAGAVEVAAEPNPPKAGVDAVVVVAAVVPNPPKAGVLPKLNPEKNLVKIE